MTTDLSGIGRAMMEPITFIHHPTGALFKIDAEPLAAMLAHRQHDRVALEAGGRMIGRFIDGGFAVICDEIRGPFDTDERSRFGFERKVEPYTKIEHDLWNASGGRICGLGDWHTHAEPDPTPSEVDMETWRRWLNEQADTGEMGSLFFVIVGTERTRAWLGTPRTRTIEQLEIRP